MTVLRQDQNNPEISARSAVEAGRLRELLIHEAVSAEPDRLPLDDQDAPRLERAGPRLAVALSRALPRVPAGCFPQRVVGLGRHAQSGLQALARAAERGRLLRHDLLLGSLEGFLAVVHAGPSTTPAALSSAMRSSL